MLTEDARDRGGAAIAFCRQTPDTQPVNRDETGLGRADKCAAGQGQNNDDD